MKLLLLVVCIVAALLIVFVLLVMLYHSNGRNEVQRKSAQFKKDVENRLQYAVHLGDDTFIIDKQDKLLVYQKVAKTPKSSCLHRSSDFHLRAATSSRSFPSADCPPKAALIF